jgi:hypothetical protein
MIRDHILYEHFIAYINSKSLKKGYFSVLKNSYSYFESFLERYENDEKFKNKLNKMVKSHIREEKIQIIMDAANR